MGHQGAVPRWPWLAAALRSAEWAEGGGEFFEQRVLADGLGELGHVAVEGFDGNAAAAGQVLEAGSSVGGGAEAVATDGEPEVVEFVVFLRDKGAEGAESVLTGGVFVGGDLVGVGEATGVDGGGGLVVGVGVGVVDGVVGEVAAAVDGAEVGTDGEVNVVAAELGLAGLVEVAGGGAELFVDEVVEGFVNGDVGGAEAEGGESAGDAGAYGGDVASGGVLVDGSFEGKPGVMLAGFGDFGVPFAGSGEGLGLLLIRTGLEP